MIRSVFYWVSTAIISLMLLLAVTYLTGGPEVAAGFTKVGYPQHLRIVLGFAKPAAALVLLLPGLARLKEWAYAGVTFALIMATIANRAAGEGPQTWMLPPIMLAVLAVSYLTRPESRRVEPMEVP